MAHQIFISCASPSGNVFAKLICEALKNRGCTVFYDYDTRGTAYFDDIIPREIAECEDFVIVLPEGALTRENSYSDFVFREISQALQSGKNIVSVCLEGFSFPTLLPGDVSEIVNCRSLPFSIDFFDSFMDRLAGSLISTSSAGDVNTQSAQGSGSAQGGSAKGSGSAYSGDEDSFATAEFSGKLTVIRPDQLTGHFRECNLFLDGDHIGSISNDSRVSFPISIGKHEVSTSVDWLKASVTVEISYEHTESVVEVFFKNGLFTNKLMARIVR